jgi:hypothetical protein
MTAVGALLSQHKGVALMINGVSVLLEMAQDRYTGRAGRCSRHEPGE